MSAPQLDLDWTITPNLRRAYTSLADLIQWWLYQNKVALVAAGWQVWWSCDGTTGPADANDHTDRWDAEAKAGTIGTTTSASSWIVLKNSDGVMLRLANISLAGHANVAFDHQGVLVLNTPTTTLPVNVSGTTVDVVNQVYLCGATTSLDRVMSIWTSGDRAWRCAVFRDSAIQSLIGMEKVTRLSLPTTFPVPYAGFVFTNAHRGVGSGDTGLPASNQNGTAALGSGSYRGYGCGVFTAGAYRACRLGGMVAVPSYLTSSGNWLASSTMENCIVFADQQPASMNGLASPTFPIYLVGERNSNLDGIWGVLVDWYQVLTNNEALPALRDIMAGYDPDDTPDVSPATPRTNWWVAMGAAALWPWRDAAPQMEIV